MHTDNCQHKELSLDRICKVKLSDENKILIDKSMLESYRKYKCGVFIDFEHINFTYYTGFLWDGIMDK